jgi:hypothetical protein
MERGRIVRVERFPEDLYRKLKIHAAKNLCTMKDVIVKAVEEYLERAGE